MTPTNPAAGRWVPEELLLDLRAELEEYELAATGESYNNTRLNAALAADPTPPQPEAGLMMALTAIRDLPLPEQDNMVSANMRRIAAEALAASAARAPAESVGWMAAVLAEREACAKRVEEEADDYDHHADFTREHATTDDERRAAKASRNTAAGLKSLAAAIRSRPLPPPPEEEA